MKAVDPIKDEYVLEDILKYFKYKNAKTNHQQFIIDRNYIMLLLGFNCGLRISDIVGIRVGDIDYDHFKIKEKKTGKWNQIYINDDVADEINSYISRHDLKKSDYVFTSRQKNKKGKKKHITTTRAYQIIKNEIEPLFDCDNLGTHTLRKTFGYLYYQRTHDIAMLMSLFNHDKQETTLAYIGITQDVKNETRKNFKAVRSKI